MVILIVDDSKLNLSIAKKILKEHYIQATILLAESGEETLNILNTAHVDIILLDIVMPGISGVEVLKKIKSEEKYKNITVIMLTSLTDMSILKQCFEHGANDFINKPIEATEFIARIKAAIREVNYKVNLENAYNIVSVQNDKLMQINKTLKETQFYITQKEKIVAVGELAAGVAHELNTPLGYVSSNFEVLKKDLDKVKNVIQSYQTFINTIDKLEIDVPEINDNITKIQELEKTSHLNFIMNDLDELIDESRNGVDKASKIVKVLRNFAGSEVEEHVRYNDLNDIIEEVLLITVSEYKDKVIMEKSLQVLPAVMCNRNSITQVLINIIINSIQAIKKKNSEDIGKIIIQTWIEDGYVVCSIVDNGNGIEPEIISRIFDPFFTTREVGEGTGLGLSVAYDIIVNKHQGQLLVNNVQPSGANFIIKLPL